MESKDNKMYYDKFIGEGLGYKFFTANHMPVDKERVTTMLLLILLNECKKERKKFKVDVRGENRGEYPPYKARVHWEDKEMTIINTEFKENNNG